MEKPVSQSTPIYPNLIDDFQTKYSAGSKLCLSAHPSLTTTSGMLTLDKEIEMSVKDETYTISLPECGNVFHNASRLTNDSQVDDIQTHCKVSFKNNCLPKSLCDVESSSIDESWIGTSLPSRITSSIIKNDLMNDKVFEKASNLVSDNTPVTRKSRSSEFNVPIKRRALVFSQEIPCSKIDKDASEEFKCDKKPVAVSFLA